MCESILSAPCVFCGYGGEGYHQKHTHDKKCPWHNVGGLEERYALLRSTITAIFKERRKTVRPKRAVQQRQQEIVAVCSYIEQTLEDGVDPVHILNHVYGTLRQFLA